MNHGRATISVDHPDALSDQPLAIRLSGFAPHQTVAVAATRVDFMHRRWRAEARFAADAAGGVDLTKQAPLAGSYAGVAPMGLFWSMDLRPGDTGAALWRPLDEGITVRLDATAVDGPARAEVEVLRRFVGAGVTEREVRDQGLVGNLFLPPGPGPHPAMISVTGSSGGNYRPLAALLASHGFATLALGYFRMDGLPPTLVEIPLEYFETAIAWLQRQPAVDADFIGVTGMSRGGELSLLLGATFPAIRAVVAYVPSGVIHGGIGGERPAWTYRGQALPRLSEDNRAYESDCVDWTKPPIALTPLFESGLRDQAAVARSLIPVERTNGPVLMISGTDDQMWPSTQMSELAMDRFRQHAHRFAFDHLVYEGAGHVIGQPYAPTTIRHSVHAVLKTDYAYGGTAEADARAAADSWPKVLAFLRAAVSGQGRIQ